MLKTKRFDFKYFTVIISLEAVYWSKDDVVYVCVPSRLRHILQSSAIMNVKVEFILSETFVINLDNVHENTLNVNPCCVCLPTSTLAEEDAEFSQSS